MKDDIKLIITPKTRILDVIAAYPETEQLLMELNPAFRQLSNPILRKTVARLATVQQVALAGKMKVEDLVNHLRKATGSDELPESVSTTETNPAAGNVPGWFHPDRVSQILDAREMLNQGEHPVGVVLASLRDLPPGEIYCLIAPFYPAPLIDKATGIGFENYSVEEGSEEFRIYFHREG